MAYCRSKNLRIVEDFWLGEKGRISFEQAQRGQRSNRHLSLDTLPIVLDFLNETFGCGGQGELLKNNKGWIWLIQGGIAIG